MSNNQDIVLNYIFTYDNSTNFVHNILNIDISNTITNFYIKTPNSSIIFFDCSKYNESLYNLPNISGYKRLQLDTYISKSKYGISLQSGEWCFSKDNKFNTLNTKKIFLPYRDFLYNNLAPVVTRNEDSRDEIIFSINKQDLLNFRNNNKFFYNSLGAEKINNSTKRKTLKSFFEFVSWFPNNEISSDPTNSLAWSLPNDYTGVTDIRIKEIPSYYQNNNLELVLYKNLSEFNEPGYKYNKKSFSSKTISGEDFFVNRLAMLGITNDIEESVGVYKKEILDFLENQTKQYYFFRNVLENNEYIKLDVNLQNQSNIKVPSELLDQTQDCSLNFIPYQYFINETNYNGETPIVEQQTNIIVNSLSRKKSENQQFNSIDDWEVEIYIPRKTPDGDDIIINNSTPGTRNGFFSFGTYEAFGTNPTDISNNMIIGLSENGSLVLPNGITESSPDISGIYRSYIFRDISGKPHHANLFEYGVEIHQDESTINSVNPTKYKGGFSIRYVFRKNSSLGYNVYIFINNNLCKKIVNGGCSLNDVNYFGKPLKEYLLLTEMQANINGLVELHPYAKYMITRVYQSINTNHIDDVYHNKNIISWDKYKPVFNKQVLLNDTYNNLSSIVRYGDNVGEKYPIYFTDNSGTYGNYQDISRAIIFDLSFNGDISNNAYLTIEDFNFEYSIEDVSSDKLHIEVSENGTDWLIPGLDVGVDISGGEWLYKEKIRPEMTEYITLTNQYNQEYSSSYPVLFYDDQKLNNYTKDYSANIIFDVSNNINKEKYLVVYDISFGHNLSNDLANDTLQIKTSTNTDKNNDASYNEIEESWLLKKNIEFPIDISNNQQINSNLNFNKNTFIQDISYGVIELTNQLTNISETNVSQDSNNHYIVRTDDISNGIILFNNDSNYNKTDVFDISFISLNNKKLSFKILHLDLQANDNKIKILGVKNGVVNDISYNDTTLFLPTTKESFTNLNNNDIINSNFDTIIFNFDLNNSANPNFAFYIYETENTIFKRYNGSIFPKTLLEKKIITIPKEVNFIKFCFEQDISRNHFTNETDLGWKIGIFLQDIYGLEDFSGNYLPQNPTKALSVYNQLGFNKTNFNEINKIMIPFKYIKFIFTTNTENTNSGWKIRIDNKDIKNEFTKVKLINTETNTNNNEIFIEDKSSINYPVHFSHRYVDNSNNVFIKDTEYSYTFDAGENNTINLEFVDFSFNKQSELFNSNGDTSGNELTQRFSINLSNDNINWYPANISWAYRTNNYTGNTSGGNKIYNYNTFFDEEDNKLTGADPNWYTKDISGFVLPENITVAIAKYKLLRSLSLPAIVDLTQINKDNLWRNINKYYTKFRYCKFILKMEHEDIVENFPEWNINIYINEDRGIQYGIIPNKNNLNINNSCFQIESISRIQKSNSTIVSQELYQDSVNFSKNDIQIPYISRYDYTIKDFSNNLLLSSQIDTDVLFNKENSNNYNYNSKREGIEYSLVENSFSYNQQIMNNIITKNIKQKYNYSSNFFNQIDRNKLPYIPEQGNILFNSSQNKAFITIPENSIRKLQRSLVSFWRADIYITYVKLVLYIWNPWSEKFTDYINNQTVVNNKLKLLLRESSADNVIEIDIENSVYKTFNVPGIPINRTFTININEYTGRYIFVWSYKVYQEKGIFNNITPAEFIYSTNINNAYTPQSNILNLSDYLKDDYIFDPSNIQIISNKTNNVVDHLHIKLNETEITRLKNYFNTYQNGLLKQYIFLDNIVFRLYLWTPNNEITYNPIGWTLPNDYYGKNDFRIKQTPYYFDIPKDGVENRIWDPFTDSNGERFFGYNIFSDGIVNLSNTSLKQDLSGSLIITEKKIRDISFNINADNIYHNTLDVNIDTTKLPNTNNYIKNNNRIPYLSRWELSFQRDESFIKSENISYPVFSNRDISLNSTYDVSENMRIYDDISGTHGGYPMIFRSENISTDTNKECYKNNIERQIVFDAGENKTISLQINKFSFYHTLNSNDNNITDISANDRLALLVSDTSENFIPINVKHLYNPNKIEVIDSVDDNGADISLNTYPSYNLGLSGEDLDNSGNEIIYLDDSDATIRNSDYSGGYIFPQNISFSKYLRTILNNNNLDVSGDTLNNFNVDISSVIYLNTNKRFVKFRFNSKDDNTNRQTFLNTLNGKYLGWNFKIYDSPSDSLKQISSSVIYQRGDLGNSSTDFNFLFSFSNEYYLELDKSVKEIYPDLNLFKNFQNTGITLGFNKNKPYMIIRDNGLLWQFVVKLPPEGYVFDELDESGNKIGVLSPVSSQNIITSSLENLRFTGDLNTQLFLSSIQLSFDETGESTTIDNGRKYIVYIRKATSKEKIFFNTFEKSTLIQFETTEILNRLSDWYPFSQNYRNSSNCYKYSVYFDEETEIETTSTSDNQENKRDPCGKCRPVANTVESDTFNQRYSRAVKINFKNAARLRGNLCN